MLVLDHINVRTIEVGSVVAVPVPFTGEFRECKVHRVALEEDDPQAHKIFLTTTDSKVEEYYREPLPGQYNKYITHLRGQNPRSYAAVMTREEMSELLATKQYIFE